MTSRFNPITLVRLTSALLVISTLFFALTIWLERTGESRETFAVGENLESGETANAPNEAGEGREGNAQAEGSHDETAEQAGAGEGSEERGEAILGINLENPWIVWGFVGISLLLAVALLRFGRTVLLLTILLASAASLLDIREVIFQVGRSSTLLASLAVIVALTHIGALILAIMAGRTMRATGLAAPDEQ